MQNKLSKAINLEYKYITAIFTALAAVYLLAYTNAYNVLRIYSPHDDALLFRMAENITEGKWLGSYHPLFLSKMPMYSVFLALSMTVGLPYLWMTAICRIIAVAFLLRKSFYLFDKAKTLLLLMGILLLFDPTFAHELRIYRYQLPAFCFIVLMASLIALFNPATKKNHWIMELADICIAATAWGFLWFSREENVLYLGFVLISLLLFCVVKKNIAYPFRNLRPVIYGLSGAFICWLVICSMNNKYYGRFIILEKTSSPYTDVIKTFHKISDPDFPDFITGSGASKQKILNIGNNVPLFKTMAEQLVAIGSRWPVRDYFNREKLDIFQWLEGMPTVSHFEWAWVDAAIACGHSSNAKELSKFYSKLDYEIKQAVKQGKLSFRDDIFLIGPYFLFKKDIKTVLKLICKYYFHFIPKPNSFISIYKDLTIQVSPHNMGNKIFRNIWAGKLKVKYIDDDDVKSEQFNKKIHNSFSNIFWNIAVKIYAFAAVPLMHFATPIAIVLLGIALKRRKFYDSLVIIVPVTMYASYYVMLTTLTVASGYDAFKIAYFIPAYTPMVFTPFAAISILLNLSRNDKI